MVNSAFFDQTLKPFLVRPRVFTIGFLGEKRWADECASKRLTVLSIHPKDRASSTASLYGRRGLPESLAGKINQIYFAVSKLAASHFRQLSLLLT